MKPWIFFGASEAAIAAAAQTELLPANIVSILVQLPLVGIIVWLQLQNQKWLEHMLEIQRQSLKEIYDGQQVFLSALLAQIDIKQNKMADRVELLTQQVAMFAATLSEVTKVDDVIDRLMEKIQK
jgi:hypothetical protein